MTWSAGGAIRARREQLGLSQSGLAQTLGVTKSLLSHIEAGNRQPTEAQISILANTLRLPHELLLVGAGRMPKDLRGALENNASGVVAAIRQHVEALPVVYPTTPQRVRLAGLAAAPLPAEVIPERIDVQKTSTAFRAHSYHTKVPPEAIRPLVRAFTRPGETVFDPFCGSGMTGVAALMEDRNALLSDLSPAAVHIARNYNTPCDADSLAEALEQVTRSVAPTIAWLYRPLGTDATVEYTTWSDVFRCGSCGERILYWEAVRRAVQPENATVKCTRCGVQKRKADLEWIGEEPVESHTSSGSNRIDSHRPTQAEMALIDEANATPIPYWIPQKSFGRDREMWRAAHGVMGIGDASGFFTRRNLHALAALRHSIISSAEGRVREALFFAFTAAVNRASKRYQWNAKRPTNVMTGTLYISSLRYEWNVWSLFRRKAADVLRYYRDFPQTHAVADVFQRSATDLGCVPDGSVDMVFMDPPFGSNIFYADSSLLWESWLGEWTDQRAEIVVNKHRAPAEGGKTLKDYGDCMRLAFEHASRVLKPSGRAVLAFSNSDDRVWDTVQKSLGDAGFETKSVHVLNKGQPSIKGVKGITGRERVTTFDLVLCLEHRARTTQMVVRFPAPQSFIERAIQQALVSRRSRTDEIYSSVIRAAVQTGYSVSGITMPSVSAQCAVQGAVEEEGRWIMPSASTCKEEPGDFISGYLTDVGSLPRPNVSVPSSPPLAAQKVPGGRGSAFYLAHSYHTKVPPEAIRPFIEHYTKPGDIVLDPFCGSGMTGVAAALAGRRAILNDLSPAAIHLSWNHTRPCDPESLAAAFDVISERLAPEFERLYGTRHKDGGSATIHWTLWSTKHQCPKCSHKFLLWDVMDRTTGRLGSSIKCPECRRSLKRADLPSLGSVPAWIAYETSDGKRFEKAPEEEDLQRAVTQRREQTSAWYPDLQLERNNEMYLRCALHLRGVSSIADFYTPRNLEALALLWREIMSVTDERLRRALAFAFTNTAWHGTRMRRFNARGGQRPLTGTLYIPQLSSEANVLEVMRNKIAQLQRYYRLYRPGRTDLPSIFLGSATSLDIPDASVDYVFTDPPFGSNIYYADCNLIWESWLGRLTDSTEEAVVNRALTIQRGGKSLEDYATLIKSGMLEIARVLKPGAWATVVFHNTEATVWKVIRDAADSAGFSFHEAASLDRRQQSHKGYKGRSGSEDVAHFDVVFNLQKPKISARMKPQRNNKTDITMLVRSVAKDGAIASQGVQAVHAEVMRRLASIGSVEFADYAEVRAIYEGLTDRSSPTSKRDMTGPHNKPSAVNRRAKAH